MDRGDQAGLGRSPEAIGATFCARCDAAEQLSRYNQEQTQKGENNGQSTARKEITQKLLHNELLALGCQKGESRAVAYCQPSGSSRVLMMLLIT